MLIEEKAKVYGEGDTFLITDLLPKDTADSAFEALKNEVQWQSMCHHGGEVPRLVAVQGQISENGSIPIYRHPSDESPPLVQFSPTVSMIRKHVENVLQHPVNHVLIQFYRSGNDYISEHSDKTIDVVPNSKIVNVSLGAERLMILRMKKSGLEADIEGKPRPSERIPLPHNSMFVLGLQTNQKWLHAIRQDRRLLSEKTPAETAFDGGRISLTFRQIGTFITSENGTTYIYGQGATGKTEAEKHPAVIGNEEETEKMIIAFGKENHSCNLDWGECYGRGLDVLHFTLRKLY